MPRASDLIFKILVQSRNTVTLTKKLKNTFHSYPAVFQKSGKTHEEETFSTPRRV